MHSITRFMPGGHRYWALVTTILLAGNAFAGGTLTIFTVGTNASCDFNSLQDAINAASTGNTDQTEIRLARDLGNQTLSIVNRNIVIDGRWPSCTSTLPQLGLLRTLTGNGVDTVITVNGNNGNHIVELRSLVIRGGGADDALNDRGGGLRIEGNSWVYAEDSRIGDNQSVLGGGAYVFGPLARLTLDEGTILGAVETLPLNANRAVDLFPASGQGGGIWCGGGGTIAIIDGRIRANTSVGDGGGLYASDCEVVIQPRTTFVGEADGFVTFFQNVAAGNGGGLYLGNGSSLSWASLPLDHFSGRMAGNRATGRGGAVFVTGSSTFVGIWVRFEDNRADGRGGALAVQGDSVLSMVVGDNFHCSLATCPGIYGTRGITEGENATLIGGAVYADSGGLVNLQRVHLYDNFANNGSAMHLSGSSSGAILHSVLIARNVLYGVGNGTSTVELTSSASAVLRHVTMSGNFRVSNQFPGIEPAASSIRANGNTGTVIIRNSLLYDDATLLMRLLAGATASGSCVFGHEGTSFPSTTILDPLYVNTTGTSPDYSLQFASPAIDRCASSGIALDDLLGGARPYDDARGNFAGPYDAGAIEYSNDLIFSDDFEVHP
jgi:predicted outer membrane repeat protein